MTKELKNLKSEQLPNDGGWHWYKLIKEANERLGQIGKHGKRAKIKVTPKPGKPISVQFSLKGKQQNPGLNLPLNKNNLIKAEEICSLITGQLVAGTYTQDWLDSLLGKSKPIEAKKALTCGEMLEQYKTHYFKQRKTNKTPQSTWAGGYKHIEKIFLRYENKPISLEIIKEAIEATENNTPTRKKHLNGLASLLKYFDNDNFKSIIKQYKEQNTPKTKSKYIPTDTEIELVYQTGFEINPSCPKKWRYRYAQWQFLYSLLAIYGLRIHEAWNIKNWNTPVYLKAGDWIAVTDDKNFNEDEQGESTYRIVQKDEIVYPVLDIVNNPHHILCIGHDTKTGYREAFPISPSGVGQHCDWVKKFNLLQSMNLPDMNDPLGTHNDVKHCTSAVNNWFTPKTWTDKGRLRQSRYGFTPHALRHAYNIRGHNLGVNQKILANSLGHGLEMNSNTYMRHEQATSKRKGIHLELEKQSNQKTEVEQAKERIAYLEDKNKYLEAENAKLKTKLSMYEVIEESR